MVSVRPSWPGRTGWLARESIPGRAARVDEADGAVEHELSPAEVADPVGVVAVGHAVGQTSARPEATNSLASRLCRTTPENLKSPVKAKGHRVLPRLHLTVLRDLRRAARRGHPDPHRSERPERLERDLDRCVLIARTYRGDQRLWRRPRRRE